MLLVLASLADGPKHGHAMIEDIALLCGTRLGPGTLCGAIARLEQQGWIEPLQPEERREHVFPTLTQESNQHAPAFGTRLLLHPVITIPKLMRVVIRTVAGIALFTVIAIAVLLGALWIDHTRETTLPTPSGPFAVGRVMYDWSDAATPDLIAPQPGTKRQVLAWIWYPAAPQQMSKARAEYLPAPWRTAIERHSGVLLTQFLTRDLSRVRVHSIHASDISTQDRSYPVVLMRAGLAAETTAYTSLAEDLASHGYVVVGFDAPYRTIVVVLPDGKGIERAPENDADRFSGSKQQQVATRLVQAWSSDMGFVLDQLERLNTSDPSGRFFGRLDMERIGVFGHSLGGATSLQFCHDDTRCKAGIDLDGAPLGSVIAEGVTQPFMFLLSDHRNEPDAEAVTANIDSIYNRLPRDRRLEIVIRGANHFGFSDDVAMLKSPLLMRALRTLRVVRLDGRRQVAVTTHYIDTFFDVYLKGSPASELKNKEQYPEVEYVH
jgi:dienelactone hydrolase